MAELPKVELTVSSAFLLMGHKIQKTRRKFEVGFDGEGLK
jgi:hypothetical protein